MSKLESRPQAKASTMRCDGRQAEPKTYHRASLRDNQYVFEGVFHRNKQGTSTVDCTYNQYISLFLIPVWRVLFINFKI